MNAEQLSKVGSDLVRRCGTRDPFQIAKELGIIVLDDCENFGQLKGMYRVVKKNRFIFSNQDLSPQTKRMYALTRSVTTDCTAHLQKVMDCRSLCFTR